MRTYDTETSPALSDDRCDRTQRPSNATLFAHKDDIDVRPAEDFNKLLRQRGSEKYSIMNTERAQLFIPNHALCSKETASSVKKTCATSFLDPYFPRCFDNVSMRRNI